VVGEAPGATEDERNEPFVGPAGKLMQALMAGAGFDLDGVAWCNTVSCWPRREPPTPSQKEMEACRGNLRDQVVASGATYVVLAGGIATSAWRSDLKVSAVHGQVFLWGRMWVVMPVFHPAAILRDRTKKKPTMEDLQRFSELVHQDRGLQALGQKCVRCGETMAHYDPDGVAYCERHWYQHGDTWKVEWSRWSNDKAEVVSKRTRGGGKKKVALIEGQGTMV
jgi:DNA polymerase